MPTNETTEFNGKKYYRYPEAQTSSTRLYFRRSVGTPAKCRMLHRDVWEYHFGEIPAGFHIHHCDKDPANNHIGNLECLSAKDHLALHPLTPAKRRGMAYRKLLERTPKPKPVRTEEEIRRRSEIAKNSWLARKPASHTCVQCGKQFDSITKRITDRFCSNACKTAFRVASGVDNVQRFCKKCEKEFTCNKYKKVIYCSHLCARHSRHWRKS